MGGINIVCPVANTMHPLCSSVRGSASGPSQCLSAELTARAWRVGLGWDFKVQRREADQRPWERVCRLGSSPGGCGGCVLQY